LQSVQVRLSQSAQQNIQQIQPNFAAQKGTTVPNNFALQSKGAGMLAANAARALPALRSSAEWIAYFEENATAWPSIPWERGAALTAAETAAVARSLQAWQLGETSDGRHLRTAAHRYAREQGDPAYARAVELFICEEQRHGAALGRFLDLAGIGRRRADWGDGLFRRVRYCITDMEVWTTPVVMVETMALVYYNAMRRATASPVLAMICRQILADEMPHLRFQCERLALLYRGRSRAAYCCTMALHRLLFLVIVALIWLGHRQALRAGGYTGRHYWRASWDRMRAAWRRMDPRRYNWPPAAASGRCFPESFAIPSARR